MDYASIKLIHETAVGLSFCGFFARGLGALREAAWVRARPAKTLPHLVDSVLLLSALALLWQLRLNPLQAPWLLAKILGLLAYVGLGVLALREGRPHAARLAAWLAAMLCFGYIVSVAITKTPLGLFVLLWPHR